MQGKNANRDKKQSGGLVRGPGTGTSDSIQKDVAPGSFIMPADSTQALGLGQKMPVNLSNGEYELPPEQVHAVGIQALTNAKDATHTPVAEPRGLGRELFFANGGPVETPEQKAARLRATTPRQTSFDATNTPGPMKAEIVSRKDAGIAPTYQQRHFPQQPSGQPFGLSRPGESQPGITQVTTPLPAKPPALQSTINAATAPVMPAEIVSRKDAGLAPEYVQRHPQPHPNQFDEKRSRELLAQNKKQPDQGAYGLGDRAGDYASGVAKTAAGVITAIPATVADYGRQGLAYASDSTLTPEQETQYRDQSSGLMSDGVDSMGRAVSGTGNLVASAIGATPNQQVTRDKPVDPAATTVNPAETAPGQDPTTSQQAPASGQAKQGEFGNVELNQRDFGQNYGKNGNIVGRTSADGVTEFSNNAADVAGASGAYVPRGLRPQGNAPSGSTLVASGTNQPIEDQSLAKTGSSANMGNGVGTFSVLGEEGDAQRAIATYDRANEQRRQMVASSRRGGIGEGGGRVSVVRDSSRAPQIAEIMNAKMDQQQARGLREDQIARQTNARLSQQDAERSAKHQQDMEIGGLGLNANRQLEAIKEQLANPNLPEDQRKQLLETYNTLTISAKDRYMEIRGGENQEGNQQASTYLDKATGRQGGGQDQKQLDLAQARRVAASNPDKRAEIEARFKKTYGHGIEE